uniref:Glycosyltransferase n=1 Tax=Actinoplanes teichomyceticus TaxID=1867 RepID=A0A1B1ESM6_ACTTI|nr:glycosyltransferase [Actinoplanes teichomyceticus]
MLDRLVPVREAHPGLPVTVWIGIQADGGDAAAIERVTAVLGHLRVPAGLVVVGAALAGRGKLLTTNAVLRVTAALRYTGWLWVDDDVELAPDCLQRLVTRFLERGGTGAVGACETAQISTTPSARMMDTVSEHTMPPYAYPAAGCMLVAADVVAGGISPRRLTDDGFVVFELLTRAPDGAAADFEVVPEARCGFCRIGRASDTLVRLRRSMYSHVVSMADYPSRTARRYFQQYLFYGLWPLAPWDGRRGPARGLVRWSIKAVHFTWFGAVAASLAVRGLAGHPVRGVTWGADGDFRTALDSTTGGRDDAA